MDLGDPTGHMNALVDSVQGEVRDVALTDGNTPNGYCCVFQVSNPSNANSSQGGFVQIGQVDEDGTMTTTGGGLPGVTGTVH